MAPIPGEVQAAFWLLVLAVLSFLTAYVRGLSQGQAQHTEQLASVRGAVERVKDAVGSGGQVAKLTIYDQLNDPNPDGSLPTGRANECGEECCAMVIQWAHHVPVEADYLRFLLGGARRQPLTTGPDLVRILALCNVKARVGSPATGELPAEVQRIVKGGGLAVLLGGWVDPSIAHWVVVTAASINGCTVADPWGGRSYNIAWSKAQGLYGGTIVEVLQRPDA